jgi:hypothetical protein
MQSVQWCSAILQCFIWEKRWEKGGLILEKRQGSAMKRGVIWGVWGWEAEISN